MFLSSRHPVLASAVLAIALATLSAVAGTTVADLFEGDPYQSHPWPDMRREFLGRDARTVFDERVQVKGPAFAEDPMNVPITVSVRDLPGIERIVVLVDRNPIRKVLEYQPVSALPSVSFRFKLEQASPVRAAVRTADGVWHIGGTWVDSAGGGCTVPGVTRADGSWNKTLNQVHARFFSNLAEGTRRLRLQIMHPMDTGLVAGVPALYIERLELQDAAGQPWWRMQLHEPVSENPLLTIEMPLQGPQAFRLSGQDNNGNRIDAQVRA